MEPSILEPLRSQSHENDGHDRSRDSLKLWLDSQDLGHLYEPLSSYRFTAPFLRACDTSTLSGLLAEIGTISLADRVSLMSARSTIPKRDNIVLFTPDSNTNPDDTEIEFIKGWAKAFIFGGVGVVLPCLLLGFLAETQKRSSEDDEFNDSDGYPNLTVTQ